MVELDRLIVCQKYVNLEHTCRLGASLPEHPTAADLLRMIVGDPHASPAVQVTTQGSSSFSFSSSSTDIRVLGAVPLNPENVGGYVPYGHAAAVLAVFVGYSTNVMWAVRMRNRLLLLNGTHHAYTLRDRGATHAPCLVSLASNSDELGLLGLGEQGERVESYFTRARPPLLSDFFDGRLCRAITIPRMHHTIQLELKFQRTRHPIDMP
jgi:hypothetical protein